MHLICPIYLRRVIAIVAFAIFAMSCLLPAQMGPDRRAGGDSTRQYVVLLRHGPRWVPNKGVAEQPLAEHGHYLNEQMSKGLLQLAGAFLDDSGGLILFNATDEAEVRAITAHDPGIVNQILEVESIRPFRTSFDAATGRSPFKSAN